MKKFTLIIGIFLLWVSPLSFAFVPADTNEDNTVNILDAITVLIGVNGGTVPIPSPLNCNGDAAVNILDVICVLIVVNNASANDPIEGEDIDNNGIWDYVDEYINTTYPDPVDADKKIAVQLTAISLQDDLKMVNAPIEDIINVAESDISVSCIDLSVISERSEYIIVNELHAIILNTEARIRANFQYTKRLDGHAFTPKFIDDFSECATLAKKKGL